MPAISNSNSYISFTFKSQQVPTIRNWTQTLHCSKINYTNKQKKSLVPPNEKFACSSKRKICLFLQREKIEQQRGPNEIYIFSYIIYFRTPCTQITKISTRTRIFYHYLLQSSNFLLFKKSRPFTQKFKTKNRRIETKERSTNQRFFAECATDTVCGPSTQLCSFIVIFSCHEVSRSAGIRKKETVRKRECRLQKGFAGFLKYKGQSFLVREYLSSRVFE
jgi:hypothetical protein